MIGRAWSWEGSIAGVVFEGWVVSKIVQKDIQRGVLQKFEINDLLHVAQMCQIFWNNLYWQVGRY
jgi:hypothetical protein